MSLSTTIHSRDLVAMARRSMVEDKVSPRALGWAVLDVLLEGIDLDEAERLAGMAWEQGDDFRLGIRAVEVLRRMNTTRRHCRWTVKLEKLPPLPRVRRARSPR